MPWMEKIVIIVDDGIATETPNAKHCDAAKKILQK
jgi:predicted phosphoribosyltransferase